MGKRKDKGGREDGNEEWEEKRGVFRRGRKEKQGEMKNKMEKEKCL